MVDNELTVKERLDSVRQAIRHGAKKSGRDPDSVALIAVSKTYDGEAVAPFIRAGQRIFGENRVEEAGKKFPQLIEHYGPLELHLVGQLQSNKANDAVGLFDAIHSVDRESLIAAIARGSDRYGKRPRWFIQVNIGEEPQKGGCPVTGLVTLLKAATVAGLDIAGLMAIPPGGVEAAPYFALLAKLADDFGLAGLSIGMSGDYGTAIMLGATHVRIGSALFGERT